MRTAKVGQRLVKLCGIGDAVKLESGNFQQSSNHDFRQTAFMLLDGAIRGQQRGAASCG